MISINFRSNVFIKFIVTTLQNKISEEYWRQENIVTKIKITKNINIEMIKTKMYILKKN